jgi:hypothetical protein
MLPPSTEACYRQSLMIPKSKLASLMLLATALSEETRLAIEHSKRLREAMRRLAAAMRTVSERIQHEK